MGSPYPLSFCTTCIVDFPPIVRWGRADTMRLVFFTTSCTFSNNHVDLCMLLESDCIPISATLILFTIIICCFHLLRVLSTDWTYLLSILDPLSIFAPQGSHYRPNQDLRFVLFRLFTASPYRLVRYVSFRFS